MLKVDMVIWSLPSETVTFFGENQPGWRPCHSGLLGCHFAAGHQRNALRRAAADGLSARRTGPDGGPGPNNRLPNRRDAAAVLRRQAVDN
jgi:hypothetical protein